MPPWFAAILIVGFLVSAADSFTVLLVTQRIIRETLSSGVSPGVAGIPILLGLVFLGAVAAAACSLPLWAAAIAIGLLVSAAVSFVVLVAMPRATQLSLMGAAIGVSADAGYAKLNDQTPVTLASALVKLADSLTKSVGLIAADAQVSSVSGVTPYFVWSLIISLIVFMGFSFLIKHDG